MSNFRADADPLPVALPELPREAMRAAPVGQELWPFPRVAYYTADQMRAFAEAALRAQAEEVERLRALLLDARLFAESCPADMGRGSLNGMRVQLLHAIDAHLKDKP